MEIIKERITKEELEKLTKQRLYKLCSGDVLYCNKEFMEEQHYHYDLSIGDFVYLYPKENSILENGVKAIVTKVFTDKKYPNKKWWQFWIKQEEYITGYHLMIV
jgi:hypothetical protein